MEREHDSNPFRGGATGTFRIFLVLVLLSLAAGGCRLIGSGSPDPVSRPGPEAAAPQPSGPFDGFLEIEGGRMDGTLTLTPRGGNDLEGFFEAPPDMVAAGRGSARGDEINLELSYEGACPGRMRLRGSWDMNSGRFSGVVRARDCTGEAEGTFLFQKN